MIKRVDLAVYLAFKTARDGTWKPGRAGPLAAAEGGVGYVAVADSDNAALITPEMKAKVEAARADIIAGRIKVSDATAQ